MQIKLVFGFFFELELANTEYQGKKTYRTRKRMNLDAGTAVKCTVFWFCRVFGWLNGQKVLVNISLLT